MSEASDIAFLQKKPAAKPFLIVYFLLLSAACFLAIWENVSSAFWLDEVFTGAVACQDSFGATLDLIRQDVHPAAYNLLIHLLFSIVGCHLWPVRLLSLASSLGGAFLLIRKTWQMRGNTLLAAALIFGNPIFWEYAFEGRAYGILFFAGSGVVTYGLSDRPNNRLKAIGFALLGALLHYYGAFLFVLLFGLAVFTPQRSKSFWIIFFCAGVLLCGYYVPQLGRALAAGTHLGWINRPTLHLFVFDFLGSVFGCVASAITIAILYVLAANQPGRPAQILLSVFCSITLLLFCASYFRPTFVYRYLHFLVPALIMGLSLTITASETGFARTRAYLLLLYLVFNLVHMLPVQFTNQETAWQQTLRGMNCTREKPCAFVLDSAPLTPAQYAAIAAFLAKEPGSFTAVTADALQVWIAGHSGTQFLYIQCLHHQLEIQQMIKALACTNTHWASMPAYVCLASLK